jgi:hypothetical protein
MDRPPGQGRIFRALLLVLAPGLIYAGLALHYHLHENPVRHGTTVELQLHAFGARFRAIAAPLDRCGASGERT